MKLKLVFRAMMRQKMSLIINTVCLSIAFSILFIVVKQVKYDFSYDTCYPKSENIYILGVYNKVDNSYSNCISMPTIRRIASMIPEVESYGITSCSVDYSFFYYEETEYCNQEWLSADSGFIKVFQPRIIAGDAMDVVKNNTGILIPQSLAHKWFGNDDPIGKKIGCGNRDSFKLVKAVYKDFPENCSMPNAIYSGLKEDDDNTEWSYFSFFRFIDQADVKKVEEKIMQRLDSISMKESKGVNRSSDRIVFRLIPMEDVYFDRNFPETLKPTGHGNLSMTLCLLAVGILVIVIAYINFINFSTALAPVRIGTMNIYKISGASMDELKTNIILEAVFLSLLAYLLSWVWSYGFSTLPLAKTYFNASLNPSESQGLYLLIGGGALLLGVLAGLYPAVYMTSFQPAIVLKGSFSMSASGRKLRDVLLIFQFVVTIILIIASFFVVIQQKYLSNHSWGFQKENIVYVPLDKTVRKSQEVLRNELLKNPNILDITASRYIPGKSFMTWGLTFKDQYIRFSAWPVAHNFLTFFNIPIVEGENFSESVPGKDQIIVNKKLTEYYKLSTILGENIYCFRNMGTIVGVAENINFVSLHHEILPMAFILGDDMWDEFIFIKINSTQIPETIRYIQSCFKNISNRDNDVTFLEDSMNRLYWKEENLSQLISLISLIAIIISLAGIYGLLIFNIRYKLKEISLRKINGAGVGQIIVLLNRIFLRLIAVSFVIACPLAYFLISMWLNGYPYRTPIHLWVFVVAGLLTLLITLIVVSYQSWRAATANPVNTLRGGIE